jgi:hypothetical protein
MSGFLDRLAARALGEAPLVHPRIRSRFEPDAAGAPAAPVEMVEEVAAGAVGSMPPAPVPRLERVDQVDRVEVVERVERTRGREPAVPLQETFESERPRRETAEPLVRRAVPEERPVRVERPVDSPGPVGERRRLSPHPPAPSPALPTARPGEGETLRERFSLDVERVVAPPLPGDGSEGGRGGRGVRVPAPQLPATLHLRPVDRPLPPELAPEPETLSLASPREHAKAPDPPPPLRPTVRSRLAEPDLPTVEPSRGAPPLPAFEEQAESEPAETVIRIDIGRIDVRAPQAPAAERRPAGPARPAGPRLTLSDYLKRRREGRR